MGLLAKTSKSNLPYAGADILPTIKLIYTAINSAPTPPLSKYLCTKTRAGK